MPSITLAVTNKVISVVAGQESQKQLAIKGRSLDLAPLIAGATRTNRISILLCGHFPLTCGDSGAFWRVHQNAGLQQSDFDAFYSLLSARPESEVTFKW
jgi:hypothetical protein